MICNFSGNLKPAQVCFFHPLLTAWGIAHRRNCKPLPLLEILFCISAPPPQQVISHPPLSGELGPSMPSFCAGPLHSRLSKGPTESSLCYIFLVEWERCQKSHLSRQSKKTDHLHLISGLTYSSEWYITLFSQLRPTEQHVWVAESTDSFFTVWRLGIPRCGHV